MADLEYRRETGGSLIFAGVAVWVAGLLVLFYFPAGMRLGQQARFEMILAGLGVLGTVLIGAGWWMRRE